MHNAFGTIVAIGIVASGFLLTGDLGWCLRQVSRSFARTDVSAPEREPDSPADQPPAPREQPREPLDQPVARAAEPVVQEAVSPRRTTRRPPGRGLDQVDLAHLTLGQRVVVWTGPVGREPACHVVHLLDPATGEALLHRHGPDGDGPARRVVVAAGSPTGLVAGSRLTRRGTLVAKPLGLAHGSHGTVETFGPIAALAIE